MYYERDYHGEMRAGVERDERFVARKRAKTGPSWFRNFGPQSYTDFPLPFALLTLTRLSDVPSGLIPMAKIHAGDEPMSFQPIPKATDP